PCSPFLFLLDVRAHRHLPSFPTRRSSDLPAGRGRARRGRRRPTLDRRARPRGRRPVAMNGPVRGLSPGMARTATFGDCPRTPPRSEEHTSELQSPCNLVCRLLFATKTSLL